MQTCPSCRDPKPARLYLCRGCWYTLRPNVRAALNRRDALAARRLSQLLDQLRADVPLHQIEVAP